MKTTRFLAPLLAFGLLGAACGSGTELTSSAGPTGQGGVDPGPEPIPSGSGAPYGSGASYGNGAGNPGTGSGGTVDPGPPMCEDDLKRCEHLFTFPAGNETSVEVRGDFAPDGWTVGVPMTKTGNLWSASVKISWKTK